MLAAYAVDLAFGDPRGLPHPVRAMGALISAGERISHPGRSRSKDFLAGAALSSLTIVLAWAAARTACRVRFLASVAETALAWTTLAAGSLLSQATLVLKALDTGDLVLARRSLAMIVGRDTALLDESEIARALIETVAESLCDGVIAPLYYLAIGGVPVALAYKAVNTLDSMIGHPEPPFTYFGRFAARLDDGMNFVPARSTALAIIAAAFCEHASSRHAWTTWRRDRQKHPSPNAGQCEAAMAGALRVKLGGTNYYSGRASIKPLLGSHFPNASIEHARRSLRIARTASALAFAVAFFCCLWSRPR